MDDMSQVPELEEKLNHFDPRARAAALAELLALAQNGQIDLTPERDVVNLHCHTFFSFNAYGYSPTALAWLARRRGFKAVGTVDFDVLDAVDEFLNACALVGVRGSCGIETRCFFPEYADWEFNSPREPGVVYHMGLGFTSTTVPDEVAGILADFQERALRRNLGLVERINAYLAPVTIDYEGDVIPLTPAGTATERHIVVAYLKAAERLTADPTAFWAARLDLPSQEVGALITDDPAFQGLVRARLMKQGGVAYVQPGPETFPPLDELHTFILGCGALPCAAWLDGTSQGESAYEEILAFHIANGAVTLNVIPDRSWNLADPVERERKLRNLYQVVELGVSFDLPINVGTEMNAFGQKLVDDFDAPAMLPLKDIFLEGAFFIYGHTILQRTHGMGFQSEWAQAHLPDRPARNRFFTQIGRRVPPGGPGAPILARFDPSWTPGDILKAIPEF